MGKYDEYMIQNLAEFPADGARRREVMNRIQEGTWKKRGAAQIVIGGPAQNAPREEIIGKGKAVAHEGGLTAAEREEAKRLKEERKRNQIRDDNQRRDATLGVGASATVAATPTKSTKDTSGGKKKRRGEEPADSERLTKRRNDAPVPDGVEVPLKESGALTARRKAAESASRREEPPAKEGGPEQVGVQAERAPEAPRGEEVVMDPVEDREAPAGDQLRGEGEVRKKAEDQAKVDTLRPAPEGDEREGPAPDETRPEAEQGLQQEEGQAQGGVLARLGEAVEEEPQPGKTMAAGGAEGSLVDEEQTETSDEYTAIPTSGKAARGRVTGRRSPTSSRVTRSRRVISSSSEEYYTDKGDDILDGGRTQRKGKEPEKAGNEPEDDALVILTKSLVEARSQREKLKEDLGVLEKKKLKWKERSKVEKSSRTALEANSNAAVFLERAEKNSLMRRLENQEDSLNQAQKEVEGSKIIIELAQAFLDLFPGGIEEAAGVKKEYQQLAGKKGEEEASRQKRAEQEKKEAAQLEDLRTQVNQLEDDLAKQDEVVMDLKQEKANLEGEAIEERLQLESEITTLGDDVRRLKGEVKRWEGEVKRLKEEGKKMLEAAGAPSGQEEMERVKKTAMETSAWALSAVKKKDEQIVELMAVIQRNSEGAEIPRLSEYIRRLTLEKEGRDQAWSTMEHGVLKMLHEERRHFKVEPWGLVTMDRDRPAPIRTVHPPEVRDSVQSGTSGGDEGSKEAEQTAPEKGKETRRGGEETPDGVRASGGATVRSRASASGAPDMGGQAATTPGATPPTIIVLEE